jgi:PHD/YefM family antitoxin component YafN of YafNO toxin-antitoxin module
LYRLGILTIVSSIKKLTKLGKAQAREQFAPIVESLSVNGGVVEVTDYGKVAAVILNYSDYLKLLSKAQEPLKPKLQLAGSGVLIGDLEKASRAISRSILKSAARGL